MIMKQLLIAAACVLAVASLFAQPTTGVIIRAARVIDGRGGSVDNASVAIKDGKIASVGAATGAVTYDLSNLTLLPGFIDTHVHIGWHFDAKGRYHAGPEPPEQALRYGAENALVTLQAGFTTVQSVGAASDKPLRDAIASGALPGPRLQIGRASCRERVQV